MLKWNSHEDKVNTRPKLLSLIEAYTILVLTDSSQPDSSSIPVNKQVPVSRRVSFEL